MARRIPMAEEASVAVQLKSLANEELLDFWAESQQVEGLLRRELMFGGNQDFERLIVLELQLRSCPPLLAVAGNIFI